MEVNILVPLQLQRPVSPATKVRNPSGLMAFLNSHSDISTHMYTALPNLFPLER